MLRLIAAALSILVAIPHALAWTHGGSGSSSGGGNAACPYGAAYADGCAAAVAANWQQPTFFTAYATTTNGQGQSYVSGTATGTISGTSLTVSGVTTNANFTNAIQAGNTVTGTGISAGCAIASGSGTSWTLNQACGNVGPETVSFLVRPPWNVAGVDYPVGIPSSVTLKDPLTLSSCSSPTPPACVSINYATPGVGQQGLTSHIIFAYGASPDINGYDFSMEGGWLLEVNTGGSSKDTGYGGPSVGNVSGTVTIENCKFVDGANFQNPETDWDYNSPLIHDSGGTTNTVTKITILHNYLPMTAVTTDGTTTSVGSFTGSTSGTTLTAGTVTGGAITIGREVLDGDVNLPAQNYVQSGSQPTWTLKKSSTVSSETMWTITQTLNSISVVGASTPGVNVLYEYNAFLDANYRLEANAGADYLYNYFEGINYNSTAHGEWTAFVKGQVNLANVSSTSSWSTGASVSIPLSATCAAIAPTVGNGLVDESKTSGSSYIGTIASCTGSTVVVTNALIAGSNGDTVGFTPCVGQCPQVNMSLNFNTFLEPSNFAGGWTSLVYYSSGDAGGNWGTLAQNNNSFVVNATKVAVTANSSPGGACNPTFCQLTFTAGQVWDFGPGLPLQDGGGIAGEHGASLQTQVSGTVGGTGVWNYRNVSNATNGGAVYISLQGDGITANGGNNGDWSNATWQCQNNFVDGAAGNPSGITGELCHQNINVGTTSFSGNVNMNLNAVQTP